ncbi:MAG: hypothetical protein AAGI23_09840 [Bacteroidota bacterium]
MRLLLFALLLSLIPDIAAAQLVELKEKGVLIVRLESGVKQKNYLHSKIEEGKNIEKWERLLAEREAAVNTKNQTIIRLFKSEYNFSDILFMYDFNSKALRDGSSEAIFLNQKMEVDKQLQLNGRPFLVVTETPSESGAEGFAVLDGDLERVKKPTPDFIKFNTIFYLFNSLGSTTTADEKMYRQAIRRLQKKFEKGMVKG